MARLVMPLSSRAARDNEVDGWRAAGVRRRPRRVRRRAPGPGDSSARGQGDRTRGERND